MSYFDVTGGPVCGAARRGRRESYPWGMDNVSGTNHVDQIGSDLLIGSAPALLADLELALELADQADQITTARFLSQDLAVERKADMTLVSDADRAVEDAIRERLREARSGDSILGEERGQEGDSPRRWIVDPIDGTHNFVRGVPVWATLIALTQGKEIAVGVVSAPMLGRRWWAAQGQGAYVATSHSADFRQAPPRRITVSKVGALKDAFFSYSSLKGWVAAGRGSELDSLMNTVWRTRGFGDFWSYMLVAEGAVDAAAEPELSLYDMAALVPIVQEAGGKFTSLDGKPGPWGGNAVATNALLHSQVLEHLGTESCEGGDD